MNWNPTYSPIWKWLRDHAGALLIAAVADPALLAAVAGPAAPTVQAVVAGLAAAGVIGTRYAKDPAK